MPLSFRNELVGRTPTSAPDPQVRLFHGGNRLIRLTKRGTKASRADQGVRPTGSQQPSFQKLSGLEVASCARLAFASAAKDATRAYNMAAAKVSAPPARR